MLEGAFEWAGKMLRETEPIRKGSPKDQTSMATSQQHNTSKQRISQKKKLSIVQC